MSQILPFKRTEAQLAGLRDLCGLWRQIDTFWEFDDVLAALAKPGSMGFFAAASDNERIWEGLVLADIGPYTADLLYIFVRPEARGARLGEALLAELVQALRVKEQIESLFLEVRESNELAQRLYRRCGMQAIGKRSRYYANGETAIVYKLELQEGLAPGPKGEPDDFTR